MEAFLSGLPTNPLAIASMWFLAVFPIVIAALAVNSSRQFYLDRFRFSVDDDIPHLEELIQARQRWPKVSIVIPARNEEPTIATTVDRALALAWPSIEVIVVDDGSTDNTRDVLERYRDSGLIRLIHFDTPRGKSKALNRGIRDATSEVVLILDADSQPMENVLHRMVPYLHRHGDVAAVTGNPRVINVPTLLTKLQAIEFSSTISTLRRGQSAWGRVNTVSGIMTVFRKSVLLRAGGFAPEQPTEDIELTWRLHRAGYRCLYEPAAQVGMEVPETLRQWWKQRTRWSRGLVLVLRRHGIGILRENEWPAFPILFEAALSILWCHVLILATVIWGLTVFYGTPEFGNTLIIGRWGALTVGVALIQIMWGMHLDSDHDRTIMKLWPLAPIYPLVYWWLSAFAVVWTTIPALISKPKDTLWDIHRQHEIPSRGRHKRLKASLG